MIPDRIVVRLAAAGAVPPLDSLIPVLHGWIRRQALVGATLIDVADYAHVPGGPGILLVADEANYAFSERGLEYQRKRPLPGEGAAKIDAAISAALAAASLIESETALRLARSPIRVESNDRLLAPNDEVTFSFWKKSLGSRIENRVQADPRERFSVLLSR